MQQSQRYHLVYSMPALPTMHFHCQQIQVCCANSSYCSLGHSWDTHHRGLFFRTPHPQFFFFQMCSLQTRPTLTQTTSLEVIYQILSSSLWSNKRPNATFFTNTVVLPVNRLKCEKSDEIFPLLQVLVGKFHLNISILCISLQVIFNIQSTPTVFLLYAFSWNMLRPA